MKRNQPAVAPRRGVPESSGAFPSVWGIFVIFVIVATTSVYRGVWFASRIEIAGVEIGLYDLLWVAVLLGLGCRWLILDPKRIDIPMALLLATSFLMVVVSFGYGQPLYNVAKLFRTELFLIAGYGIGLTMTGAAQSRIMRALVLGGTITGLSQILTFLFASRGIHIWALLGVPLYDGQLVYWTVSPSVTEAFRDHGVTINFAVLSAAILLTTSLAGRPIVRPPLGTFLLAINTVGIVVSLTRTSWVALVIAAVAAFLVVRRVSAVQLFVGMVIGLASMATLLVLTVVGPAAGYISQIFQTRLATGRGSQEDITVKSRWIESSAALDELNGKWLFGVGAADVRYWSEATGPAEVVSNQLHNGFVQYLLAGGFVGLLILISFVCLPLVRGLLVAIRPLRSQHQVLIAAALVAIVSYLFTSFFGGVVNDSYQSPIFGLLLGVMVSSNGQEYEARSRFGKRWLRRPGTGHLATSPV